MEIYGVRFRWILQRFQKIFSASDFLKQGMDIRDDLYDGVKQNELYQSVMSQMNVDTIWNTASNGLPSVQQSFRKFV